jgi:pimeloyl-ACP methyl ester carboxylesterase
MKETAFLLHGFASSARTWDATRTALDSEFRVITPDWPGFGKRAAEAPLHSAEEMAQFVIAHADTFGLERFHVLGYSMSGFVVQELLLSHAARIGRAVLYGAGARVDPVRRFEPLQRTIERLQADGVEKAVERVAATWFCAGDAALAYKACVEAGRHMSLDAAVAAMRAFEASDYRERLGAVSRNVLVIMGERDRTFPIEMGVELRDAIPGAQICVLPGCAHAAHLERPDLFNRVVCEFLIGR